MSRADVGLAACQFGGKLQTKPVWHCISWVTLFHLCVTLIYMSQWINHIIHARTPKSKWCFCFGRLITCEGDITIFNYKSQSSAWWHLTPEIVSRWKRAANVEEETKHINKSSYSVPVSGPLPSCRAGRLPPAERSSQCPLNQHVWWRERKRENEEKDRERKREREREGEVSSNFQLLLRLSEDYNISSTHHKVPDLCELNLSVWSYSNRTDTLPSLHMKILWHSEIQTRAWHDWVRQLLYRNSHSFIPSSKDNKDV